MSTNDTPICTDGYCVPPKQGAAPANTITAPTTTPSPSTSSRPLIHIDITSDQVCPWCYVGKRRLEKAIAAVKGAADFEIRWHPFQLDPNFTGPSQPKMDRYRAKFGPRVEGMLANMMNVGKAEGIAFKYSNEGRIGNTLDSHRLMEFAWEKGGAALQNRLINELFAAYFEREQDISDHAQLVNLATNVGLDAKETETFLKSDRLRDTTTKAVRAAYENNVSGVPHFSFEGGKYEVGGAQDASVFLNIFKRLGIKV